MKHFFCLLFFSILAFTLPVSTIADQSKVRTSVIANYQIQPDGSNQVQQIITLTNTSADAYVTQYILEINSNRIENIQATDQLNQNIPFTIQKTDSSTIMLFQFDSPVVGLDQSRVINVSYTNPDVSYKVGNILEINIPQISNPQQYSQYQTNIIVPNEVGLPSEINPSGYQLSSDPALLKISYSKDQLLSGGLILFGEEQYYQLKATIPLSNNSITPIDTQFVIPPDTQYQKVFINSLTPPPATFELDQDGNWLVTYRVEAKQQIEVQLDQSIITYNKPTLQNLPSNNLNLYLEEQSYWELSDPLVSQVSREHTNPKQIYQYLVDNFQYNYARIDHQSTHRLGAKQALQDPQNALCLEFSDSFISLSRSNNIPTRLITGYAYTQNPNLKPLSLVENSLHGWVEYYDIENNVWHAVDPTWGSTANGIDYFSGFDFNHIAFAILGASSQSPLPLGYHKTDNEHVDISFSDQSPTEYAQFDLETHIPLSTNLGITNHLDIEITNNSNIAIYKQPITISSKGKAISTTSVEYLLPFTKTIVQVQFMPEETVENTSISIQFYEQTFTKEINQFPSYTGFIIFTFATGITSLIGIIAYRSRSILVSKR